MADFERKEKYIVIKIEDLERLNVADQFAVAQACNRIDRGRFAEGKPHRNFVCIHDGMACYEAAWKLVEDEVNGKV